MKDRLKLFIRNTVSNFLFRSYISTAMNSFRFRKNALILAYHRVIDPQEWIFLPQTGMYVTKDHFAMHMRYLQENFNIVPIETIVRHLQTGKQFSAKTCSITFDDGWQDNFVHALPILNEHHIPATIFLSTRFIGTDASLWSEEVNQMLNYLLINSDLKISLYEYFPFMKEISKKFRRTKPLADYIIDKMVYMPYEDINEIVERLRELTRNAQMQPKRHMLSWSELAEMSKYNITFGSHGDSHRIMTSLNEEELASELSGSLKMIEKAKISFVPYFCYPNGRSNNQIRELLPSFGYQCAFGNSTKNGVVKLSSDLFEIPRLCIDNDSTRTVSMYASRINGL